MDILSWIYNLKMIIYLTKNLINGKKYIGRDLKNNSKYLGSGLLLKKAIKKYGISNFKKIILEKCKTEKELNEKECFWIKKFDAINSKDFYNLVSGGRGGNILKNTSEKKRKETYNKISKSKLGKNISENHKNKIKSFYKKEEIILSEEEKKKRKLGKYNNFFGKKHTGDMTRFSTRKNIPPTNAKSVMNISNGIIYKSCWAAAQIFDNPNTARRAISDVCKGKRDHFKNIKFEYKK